MTSLDWEKPGVNQGGGTVSPATSTSLGTIQLAQDLGGTATAPTVPGLVNKANSVHTHSDADISNAGAAGKSLLEATTATAAKTAISAADAVHSHTDADISNAGATGKTLLETATAAAARTALSAVLGTGLTEVQVITQANYTALGAGASATTLYIIQG